MNMGMNMNFPPNMNNFGNNTGFNPINNNQNQILLGMNNTMNPNMNNFGNINFNIFNNNMINMRRDN